MYSRFVLVLALVLGIDDVDDQVSLLSSCDCGKFGGMYGNLGCSFTVDVIVEPDMLSVGVPGSPAGEGSSRWSLSRTLSIIDWPGTTPLWSILRERPPLAAPPVCCNPNPAADVVEALEDHVAVAWLMWSWRE